MILLSIKGGLGNQMFQYACGRAVADRLGTELKLDLSFLNQIPMDKNLTKRDFELDNFTISARIAKKSEINQYVPDLPFTKFWLLYFKLLRIINYRHIFHEKTSLIYNSKIELVKDNTYLSGYWQSEFYFSKIAGLIKSEFRLKDKLSEDTNKILTQIAERNSVSLHIRRGDYLNKINENVQGVLSLDYYKSAVNIIQSKVENPFLFVFTDDIKWVAENFKVDIPFCIVERDNPEKSYEDLWLMSRCNHHIIANSSFSWWGAWLNPTVSKIVIAPKNWIVKMPINSSIFPDNWIRI
jgi:hypothetical protein